jgi:hypothetical protein
MVLIKLKAPVFNEEEVEITTVYLFTVLQGGPIKMSLLCSWVYVQSKNLY